jgi:hypothetical protein
MYPVNRQYAIAAIVGLLIALQTLRAEPPKPTEYQVQAAYLYNFGKFVQWPAAALAGSGTFTLCVLGDDPFGTILDTTVAGAALQGKTVGTKRIVTAREATSCQILFISPSEDRGLDKILEALNKAAVLTVSNMPQFTERGGMIQFILEESRVRFRVNLTAAQNVGLLLSSQLLKLAAVVRRNPSGGE